MDISILKDLLKERGMTFQELCDTLKVDRANLHNSLTKGNPTLSRLEAIAEVLKVPVWRLFIEENKPELYGIVVYDGKQYAVNSIADFDRLHAVIHSISNNATVAGKE